MKVLGALEFAEGRTLRERYEAVSRIVFRDEEGAGHQFTWRTIQTWWYYYRIHGITEAPERSDKGGSRKVAPEDLREAVGKVLPGFRNKKYNIAEVYRACIEQGLLRRSQIAPNTFRRHVNRFDLLKPASGGTPKARLAFSKAHANDMWQTDTLHGPYIRIGGQPVQTYLICFIDDASRVIPHGEFHTADNTPNLIGSFRIALLKRGIPKAVYADNGSNYRSREFAVICARLGAVLIHTPVRDGAAKGKIERFFRTVRDQFLVRDLKHVTALAMLNDEFNYWVENIYHQRIHSTLDMKPIDRFGLDLGRLRYLAPSGHDRELFYDEASRKVRADNTFSLRAIRYEAPRDLRGKSVPVRFDRHDPDAPPVVYAGDLRLGEAHPVDYLGNDRFRQQ